MIEKSLLSEAIKKLYPKTMEYPPFIFVQLDLRALESRQQIQTTFWSLHPWREQLPKSATF